MSGNAMNCDWSSENLLAGYREELSEPDSRSLTNHLDHCEHCRNDRQEMVLLQEAIASIPEIEPAAGSFDALKSAIQEESAMAGPTGRGRLLLFGGALAAAAAAVLAFVLFLLPPSPPARLTSREGLLTVDGASVAKGTEFTPASGSRLVTGSLALVAFAAPRAGEFTLGKGTKVTCISEGRFRLEAGRLLAEIRPDIRVGAGGVAIETSFGTVEVTGTTFDLDLTTGNLIVSVLNGAVTLRTGDKPVRVDSGTAVTVLPGGQPGPPQPVDPYRVRRWCSTPTARLEASPTHACLTFILTNETVRPLAIKPYDPSVGVYALRIERVGIERMGAGGAEDVKLQEAMLTVGVPDGPPDTARTLKPGETYELAIDPSKLGLSPGSYTVRAVYNPYTKDLPAGAWRGVLISPPADLTVR